MTDATARTNRLVLAAFLAFVVLGGTNMIAVRFSLRELPPFWGASIRFFAAVVLLAAFAAVRRLEFPRGRALVGAVIYGLLGFGAAYAFGYLGLRRVPAGTAAVTLALTPLITFGLAVSQGQEPFRWRPLAGGVVALGGIALMFRGAMSSAVPVIALLALLAMAGSSAEASIAVKGFPRSHPVTMNVVAMLTGALLLLVLSFIFREPHPWPGLATTWVAMAYLVILGSSTAFVLFLYVLKNWSASSVSYQFVLFPFVAVTLSVLLERVSFPPSLLAGMAVVLAGVYVGTVSRVPFVRTPHRLGTEPCLNCAE
jgi:drug/metabolite transporter (DMT)-like permease